MKIAGISYLNSRPYFYPLVSKAIPAPGIEIDLMTPAEANAAVISGAYDAGLISLVAWLDRAHSDDLIRIEGLEIAAIGPVASILLFSKKPWSEIASVSVTQESATSVELLRVLYRIEGRELAMTSSEDPMKELEQGEVDGALLIGDAALKAAGGGSRILVATDLGERWYAVTGLPMVYAVFVVRREAIAERARIENLIRQALEWSEKHSEEICAGVFWQLRNLGAEEYLRHFEEGRRLGDLDLAIRHFASLRPSSFPSPKVGLESGTIHGR